MLRKVKVRTAVNTLNFLKSNREIVSNVVRILCIVRKLVVVMPLKIFFGNTVFQVEIPAVFTPSLKCFVLSTRLAEIFHFHLLEFAGTENKVFENNLIAERFSYLSNTERYFHTVRLNYVLKVYEN